MSSTDTVSSGPNLSIVHKYTDEILALPDGEFRLSDVSDELEGIVRSFREWSIVRVAETETDFVGKPRHIYEVDQSAREYAQEQVEDRDSICPCGHAGIENHGDYYTCGFDLCEHRFLRCELEVSGDE